MTIPINTLPAAPSFDYPTLRSQLRSGDILLCSGSSVFSSLIQQATKSIWSHVAFILRLEVIDRIMVLESVESIGVRAVPLSCYAQNYNGSGKPYPGKALIARHANFNAANIPHLSKFAVDLLGYPYDKDEIIQIAARLSGKALNIPEQPKPIGQNHAYICSEYAYECYKSVGINIDYDPAGFVTPADFAQTAAVNALGFIATENGLLSSFKEKLQAAL